MFVYGDMSTQWVVAKDYPSSNVKSFTSSFTLYWRLITNPTSTTNHIIEFGCTCKATGYVTIGFGHEPTSGMKNADVMFGYFDKTTSKVVIQDAWVTSKSSIPTIDTKDDFLQRNGGQQGGVTHLKWTRYLNTGDTKDKVIPYGTMLVSWAYHSSSTSISATHTNQGKSVSINFQLVAPGSGGSNNNTGGSGNGTNPVDNGGSMDDDENGLGEIFTTNVFRFHLVVTGAIAIPLMIIGLIYSVILPYFKPNMFTDLLFYRKFTKIFPYKILDYLNPILEMTLGEFIIVISYIIVNAAWFAYGYLNADSEKVSKAFAQVNIFNFSIVLIPVTRYSALQAIFGISFERSLKYHKWIGLLAFASVTAHGIAMLIEYGDGFDWNFMMSVNNDEYPLFGVIAWIAMLFLVLLSFEPIRRKLWELFYYSHILLVLITFGFSIAHGKGFWRLLPMMGISIILYLFDLFLRFVIGYALPTELVKLEYHEECQTTICTFRKKYLSIKNANLATFIFVYIPSISLYQYHPITISNSYRNELENTIEFTCHIKNIGTGWSAKLAQLAQNDAKNGHQIKRTVRVEGGYGNLSIPLLSYNTIVLFGGGVGITPIYALYHLLLQQQTEKKRKIYIFWTVREEKMLSLFPDFFKAVDEGIYLQFYVSKPLPKDDLEKGNQLQDERIVKGNRLNVKSLLERVRKETKDDFVGVFACGPSKMITDIHNACWDCSSLTTAFHLHKEEFEF
ncbi:hypothetical protein ABK040_002748 [Willaertia magna]